MATELLYSVLCQGLISGVICGCAEKAQSGPIQVISFWLPHHLYHEQDKQCQEGIVKRLGPENRALSPLVYSYLLGK